MAKNRAKILIRRVMRDRSRDVNRTPITTIPSILAVENWPKKWQDIVKKAKVIAAYMPLTDELSLDEFWQSPLLSHCKKCFPKVEGEQIVFYECMGIDDMKKGSFGIMEPGIEGRSVDPVKIDLMFIPASAYAKDGTRLGRGKGFYDRYYASWLKLRSKENFNIIGVVRPEAFLQSLPSDEWDLKVEAVVTTSSFMEVENEAY